LLVEALAVEALAVSAAVLADLEQAVIML